TDLGIREALGNHHFVGSGCLASWDQLDAGHRPAADADWVSRQGVAADGTYATAFDAARERIAKLLGRPRGPPPLNPYYPPPPPPRAAPGAPPPPPRRRSRARAARPPPGPRPPPARASAGPQAAPTATASSGWPP